MVTPSDSLRQPVLRVLMDDKEPEDCVVISNKKAPAFIARASSYN